MSHSGVCTRNLFKYTLLESLYFRWSLLKVVAHTTTSFVQGDVQYFLNFCEYSYLNSHVMNLDTIVQAYDQTLLAE